MVNATNQSPPTVLVVDDDGAIASLCAMILREAGFQTLQAEGSSEALKICTEHQGPIDLLLTDLVLPPPGFQLASSGNRFPHVHGHELAKLAASIRAGLRVALMSGNPDQELASHGITRGKLPYIQKPVPPDQLISFVRQVLAAPAPVLDPSAKAGGTQDIDWFG
jgi:DNA-binding NtrC family response regulator